MNVVLPPHIQSQIDAIPNYMGEARTLEYIPERDGYMGNNGWAKGTAQIADEKANAIKREWMRRNGIVSGFDEFTRERDGLIYNPDTGRYERPQTDYVPRDIVGSFPKYENMTPRNMAPRYNDENEDELFNAALRANVFRR